jgi:hypothetical protein
MAFKSISRAPSRSSSSSTDFVSLTDCPASAFRVSLFMERILSPASAGFLMFAYQKDTFFFSIHNFRLYLAPNADKHKKG